MKHQAHWAYMSLQTQVEHTCIYTHLTHCVFYTIVIVWKGKLQVCLGKYVIHRTALFPQIIFYSEF